MFDVPATAVVTSSSRSSALDDKDRSATPYQARLGWVTVVVVALVDALVFNSTLTPLENQAHVGFSPELGFVGRPLPQTDGILSPTSVELSSAGRSRQDHEHRNACP